MAGPRKERPLGVTILAAVSICGGPMFVLAGLVWLIVTRNILLFFVPFGAIPSCWESSWACSGVLCFSQQALAC